VASTSTSHPYAFYLEGVRDYVQYAVGLVDQYKDLLPASDAKSLKDTAAGAEWSSKQCGTGGDLALLNSSRCLAEVEGLKPKAPEPSAKPPTASGILSSTSATPAPAFAFAVPGDLGALPRSCTCASSPAQGQAQ
jgi:hypothetical protein